MGGNTGKVGEFLSVQESGNHGKVTKNTQPLFDKSQKSKAA